VTVKPIKPKKREWLRQARKEKGFSTQGIAEIFGISPTHYNDIENGNRNPGIELAIKMADFFKVPILKFLRDRTKFETERLEKI